MDQTTSPANITSTSLMIGSTGPDVALNDTLGPNIPLDEGQRIYIVVANAIIAIIITIVNVPVLVVWTAGNRRKHTPSSAVVVNLIIFDMSVAGALCLRVGVLLSEAMANNAFVCIFHFGCLILGGLGMQMSLLLAVVDRYIAVVHSLRYHQIVTYRVVSFCVIATHVTMIIVSFSPLIPGFNNWGQITTCTFNLVLKTGYLYVILGFITLFMVVSLSMYARVLNIARQHQKKIMAAVRIPGYSVTGGGPQSSSTKQLCPQISTNSSTYLRAFQVTQDSATEDTSRTSLWTVSSSNATVGATSNTINTSSISDNLRDNFTSPGACDQNSLWRTGSNCSEDRLSQILARSNVHCLNIRKDFDISRYKTSSAINICAHKDKVSKSSPTMANDTMKEPFVFISKRLYTNENVYLGNSEISDVNYSAQDGKGRSVDEGKLDTLKEKDNVTQETNRSNPSVLSFRECTTADQISNGDFDQGIKKHLANCDITHSNRLASKSGSDLSWSANSPNKSPAKQCWDIQNDSDGYKTKNSSSTLKRKRPVLFTSNFQYESFDPLNTPTLSRDSKEDLNQYIYSHESSHGRPVPSTDKTSVACEDMITSLQHDPDHGYQPKQSFSENKERNYDPVITFVPGKSDMPEVKGSVTPHEKINSVPSLQQQPALPTLENVSEIARSPSSQKLCHNEPKLSYGTSNQVKGTSSNPATTNKETSQQLSTHTESAKSKKRRLRQSGIANVVFCCCWFPFVVVQLLMINNYEMSLVPNNTASFLIMIDAILNPFIYVWGNARMRTLMVNWWRQQHRQGGSGSRESQLVTFSETV